MPLESMYAGWKRLRNQNNKNCVTFQWQSMKEGVNFRDKE